MDAISGHLGEVSKMSLLDSCLVIPHQLVGGCGQNHFTLMADKKANENNLKASLSRPGNIERKSREANLRFGQKRNIMGARTQGGSKSDIKRGSGHKTGCWGIKKE